MPTARLNIFVPESRQVTLTLPPNFPIGEMELEVTVREPVVEFTVTLAEFDRAKAFPPRPTNPALVPEYEAFEQLLPELMKQYAGKYVALRNGVVVAVGTTEIDVFTAAHQQHPGALVYTRLVTDQPQPGKRI